MGNSSKDHPTGRSRQSFLIAAGILTSLAILVNWPLAYTEATTYRLNLLKSPIDFETTTLGTQESPLPVMAGWPMRYWISYPTTDAPNAASPISLFSLSAFLLDAAMAAGLVGFVLIYLWRSRAKKRAESADAESPPETLKTSALNIKLSIADLLFLTLLIAAPLGLWGVQERRSKQQIELAQLIRQSGGKVEMSAWVPRCIKTHMPLSISRSLKRIRGVQIEHPSNEIVNQILGCRELTTLRLGGGQYDLELLYQLARNPHLVDLRIGGREISDKVVQSIAQLPRLETLNLIRTNVDLAMLQPLRQLTRLKNVGLVRTNVLESDFSQAPFSQSVQRLILPHPIKVFSKPARNQNKDKSTQPPQNKLIRIAAWPNLRTIAFNDFDSLATEQLIEVQLSDLPKLESVDVDLFQKVDLKLSNLPSLVSVDHIGSNKAQRIPAGGSCPGSLWLKGLKIDGAEKLETLTIYAPDIEQFSVAGTPNLKLLNVSAYRIQSDSQTRYVPLPQTASKVIINGFLPDAAPEKIDFDSVSLGKADLSPLAQQTKLVNLSLNETGIEFDSIKSLAGASHLQHFAANDLNINSDQLKWILSEFKQLKTFSARLAEDRKGEGLLWNNGIKLTVKDHANLGSLDLGQHWRQLATHIAIDNCPKLNCNLPLGYATQSVAITNSPSFEKLVFKGPLPKSFELGKLPNLKTLAMGGSGVTNRVMQSFSDSTKLTELTLAYPAITPEAASHLPINPRLRVISLAGTPLSDAMVNSWPEMRGLEFVDIRDTKITEDGLGKLMSNSAITHLCIDRCPMQQTALSTLGQQQQLQHLSLSGIGTQASALGTLLQNNPGLQFLDLSECNVDDLTLDQIGQHAANLDFLSLRNSKFNNASVARLARQRPKLIFEISPTQISTKLSTQLIAKGRIETVAERQMRLANEVVMKAISSSRQRGQNINWAAFAQTAQEDQTPEHLDVASFMPRPVSQTKPGQSAPMNEPKTGSQTPRSSPIGVSIGNTLGNVFGDWLSSQDKKEPTDDDPDSGDEREQP